MLKNHFFWASVLLLGVNLFFGFRLKESIKVAKSNSEIFSEKENYLIGNINNATFLQSLALRVNGMMIPENELTSELSKKVMLSELIDSEKFVFNFRETDCDICLEQQFAAIKALPSEVLANDVVLIGNFSHVRDMRTFKRSNKIDLPIYMSETPLLEMADGHGVPALFLVAENMSVTQAFFPIKEVPGLTESFYVLVSKLLGESN
ncbi:MAG: hypothetical protein HEP71_20870 [Roseivirga sp.]|nr:hypothetical protein [Roseivirga sp.]